MDKKKQNQQIKAYKPNYFFIILFSLTLGYLIFSIFQTSNENSISYTDFKENIKNHNISGITITGNEITGDFNNPFKKQINGNTLEIKNFKTIKPSFDDPELLPMLEESNVKIDVKSTQRSWFQMLLINLLPWILIIGFFIFISRRMQENMGGQGSIFNFAQSKAKLYQKSSSKTTFKDVAGLDNAKKEFFEIIDFLKNPKKYIALGAELPRGILLIGPPGNGKTLLARATAGEAEVPFYSISGSEFIEMLVGVGASRVRDMFKKAKKDSPSIIFIDEIDSIGRIRGTGLGGGHDEREQTLNQILSEMDGFEPHESVIVIAATNRPDVLDPALIRPGRFDRQITLDLPHKEARKRILGLHSQKIKLSDSVDFDSLAARTIGFTGADLKNLVNEAVLLAARDNKKEVDINDFEKARDKIILGIERDDLMNEEEKELVAYHESGHTLVAKLLPGVDPIKKVTIIPRGRALGVTEQIPEEDKHNLSCTYLYKRIAVILGGRAAEKVIFKEVTTGASNDLKQATSLARKMVCQFGMSKNIGPVAFNKGETHPFLGKELTEQKDFSENTAKIIDEEVKDIISSMEEKAVNLLEENKEKLIRLSKKLLKEETLENEDIDKLLALDQEKIKKDEKIICNV